MNIGIKKIQQILVALFVGIFSIFTFVHAGPITKNPDGSPFSKLSVYQGVISIVPGGATDSVMEIGNAGRDIASTGDIYIRPGGLNTGISNYAKLWDNSGKASLIVPGTILVGPQDAINEGGEIVYQPAGTNRLWHTDVYQNTFRFFSIPNSPNIGPTATIDSSTGDLTLNQPNAKFCFFGGSCHTWNDITGAGGSLETTLSAGNKSDASIILGQGTGSDSGTAMLDITQNNGSKNAIVGKQDSPGNSKSGIYGENSSATGWAGNFNNRVNITGDLCFNGGNCASSWSGIVNPTLEQVLGTYGNTAPGLHMSIHGASLWPKATLVVSGGEGRSELDTINTYNSNVGGSAIFAESTDFNGYAGNFKNRLNATNNNNNSGIPGSALVAVGSNTGLGGDYASSYGISGPAAVEAWGGNAPVGQTTYGIFAGGAYGTAYAGYFYGPTAFVGDANHPLSVTKGGNEVLSLLVTNGGINCNEECIARGMVCAMVYSGNCNSKLSFQLRHCTATLGATNSNYCFCK